MEILKRISELLIAGEDGDVARETEAALAGKIPAEKILRESLIAGMDVVGEKFRTHEFFLPEVLLAARAMNAGMERLRPLLEREGAKSLGRVVLGSVQGDLHDIGKNLVAIMLRGAGFDVIDLGNDVSPERFVKEAREREAEVIGMSALLTTTMPAMKAVVEELRKQGLAGKVKTIVGGAPVSEEFAREIGADAYGFDAANAVEKTQALAGR